MERGFKWMTKLLTEHYFQQTQQKIYTIGKSFLLLILEKICLIDLKKKETYQIYNKEDNFINLIKNALNLQSQIGHCYQCLGKQYIQKDFQHLYQIQKELRQILQNQRKYKQKQKYPYKVLEYKNFNQKHQNLVTRNITNSTIGIGNKTNLTRLSEDKQKKNNHYQLYQKILPQNSISRYNFINNTQHSLQKYPNQRDKTFYSQNYDQFQKQLSSLSIISKKQPASNDQITRYVQNLPNANIQFNEFTAKMKIQNKFLEITQINKLYIAKLQAKVPPNSKTYNIQKKFLSQGQSHNIKQAKQKASRKMLLLIYTTYPLLWQHYLDQKKKL